MPTLDERILQARHDLARLDPSPPDISAAARSAVRRRRAVVGSAIGFAVVATVVLTVARGPGGDPDPTGDGDPVQPCVGATPESSKGTLPADGSPEPDFIAVADPDGPGTIGFARRDDLRNATVAVCDDTLTVTLGHLVQGRFVPLGDGTLQPG